MKKIFAIICILALSFLTGCTRIETGEVGLRVGFDKQVQATELMPGSFNQVLVGDIITFPVKDVSVDVADQHPLAKDNSTMKDFDVSVVYSIAPTAVSDLWISKSRSFHATAENGDVLLMYSYISQTTRNAVYKVARNYEALVMNDNRETIEQQIREEIAETFNKENLNGITITQVQVRAIAPSDSLRQSADELVRAKLEEKTKEVEVRNAALEAQRVAALNANKGAIEYMNAQSLQQIAYAVREGKVSSIILPYDFKGIVNIK